MLRTSELRTLHGLPSPTASGAVGPDCLTHGHYCQFQSGEDFSSAGLATLLLDLLTLEEEQDRANVFDISWSALFCI
jgi:hypothetical protein